MADLGLLRQETLYLGDRPGAGDAGRFVQQEGAGQGLLLCLLPYQPSPRSTKPVSASRSSSLASSGLLPRAV